MNVLVATCNSGKDYSVKITVQNTTCAEKIFLFCTDLDLKAILMDDDTEINAANIHTRRCTASRHVFLFYFTHS